MELRNNRTLLHEEVLKALYDFIDQNEIKPGEQFPSEQELVRRWGISRNVLREAFHVLETRGVVISHQGKGRYLRELPDREIGSVDESLSRNLERYSMLEIYLVRQQLECLSVRLAVRHATAADLLSLEAEYQDLVERFTRSNTTTGEFLMHQKYAEISRNSFLKQVLDMIRKITLDMMSNSLRNTLESHTIEASIHSHQKLLEAFRRRDEELASQTMFDHIQDTIDKLNENKSFSAVKEG